MSPTTCRFAWSIGLLLVIVAGIALWWQFRASEPGLGSSEKAPRAEAPADATAVAPREPEASLPPLTVMPTAAELDEALRRPDSPVENLQAVEQLIGFYRRAFGGNPVGQNEDIAAAIAGANPGRAAFLPIGSPAIRNGKLVDSWGTPYWFHPVSSKHMEIRSAGPDRELFTGDDLTVD